MGIQCVCKVCGKEFAVWPSYLKRGGGQYCSNDCKFQASITSTEKTCLQCGKVFLSQPHREKDGRGKFCSVACRATHQTESGTTETACATCKTIFRADNAEIAKGKALYCSPKCGYAANSKYEIRNCEECGSEFRAARYMIERGAGRFCSKKCTGRWSSRVRVRENSSVWNGGTSFVNYPPEFSRDFKKRIKDRDGNVCAICSMPAKLEVHHIDYDRKRTVPENCISLCKDCHARVHAGSKKNRPALRIYWTKILSELAATRMTKATDNESQCNGCP